jgi:serine/threonine protein phosphatase PrpC
MEDTHCIHLGPARGSQRDVVGICAVFDGHCGKDVADIACRLFPEIVFTHQLFGNDNVRTLVEALIETDKAIHTQLRGSDGGSTHISSLVFNNMLFVIGLGDARAVLCDNGSAICMSRDHKPSDPDERRRVLAAGGTVQWERVGGCLAVSRALGDWEFKFSGPTYPDNTHFPVSNIGEVTQINITDTTEFLILACDGLWDVVSNEEAVRFVSEALRKAPKAADATGRVRTLNNISLALANYALEKRSMDNVTVVIQTFH